MFDQVTESKGAARLEVPGVDRYSWEQALRARGIAEGLSKPAHHIALVMSTYATKDGEEIRPTNETLAQVSGWSSDKVKRARRELREAGWILEVERGSNTGSSARASVYVLRIPEARGVGDTPLSKP